jgi:repressor LexA
VCLLSDIDPRYLGARYQEWAACPTGGAGVELGRRPGEPPSEHMIEFWGRLVKVTITVTDAADSEPPELTARQQQIVIAIQEWTETHGYPPTLREIGAAVGLVSPSSVVYQLKELESKGVLRRDPDRPRAVLIRDVELGLPQDNPTTVFVPLVGTIAAGGPILAEETVQGLLPLPRDLVGHGVLFCLNVQGDSMIDASICDGDIVVVRQQPTAENGDVVAAMIDGEATVKVYRVREHVAELVPRNPAYQPIPADRAVILGRVVSVVRRL